MSIKTSGESRAIKCDPQGARSACQIDKYSKPTTTTNSPDLTLWTDIGLGRWRGTREGWRYFHARPRKIVWTVGSNQGASVSASPPSDGWTDGGGRFCSRYFFLIFSLSLSLPFPYLCLFPVTVSDSKSICIAANPLRKREFHSSRACWAPLRFKSSGARGIHTHKEEGEKWERRLLWAAGGSRRGRREQRSGRASCQEWRWEYCWSKLTIQRGRSLLLCYGNAVTKVCVLSCHFPHLTNCSVELMFSLLCSNSTCSCWNSFNLGSEVIFDASYQRLLSQFNFSGSFLNWCSGL